jgi:uncharacterized protein YndB with AHSA1/START domain
MPTEPSEATTTVDRDTARATAIVDASPEAVFDFLRRPANHVEISGDRSVRGTIAGPESLSAGDRFRMRMRIKVPYRMTSKVVEFEQNRRIAWCHVGGHRWRWELEPAGEGRTRVTETFDLSTAKAPWALRLLRLPKGHERNVAESVRNVADHFARPGG